MAKAMSITVAAADAMLTAFGTLCNSGTVVLYSGTMPTNVQTALSGNNVLAIATLPNPAFTAFDTVTGSRRYTAGTITGDSAADLTGTATFFRVINSSSVVVWQGTVGTTDSDMIMADAGIIQGGPVNISSLTVSLPMS